MTIRIEESAKGVYTATITGVHGTVHEDVTHQIGRLIADEAAKRAETLEAQRHDEELTKLRKAVAGCTEALRDFTIPVA